MILVTGATGNIGREVVTQLIAAGWPVRAFVRDARRAPPWGTRVDIAIGDFREPESAARACAGVQSVLLIAVGTDDESFSKVLAAAQRSGASHVVFVSGTVAEWVDSAGGAWFHNREKILGAFGLRWTVLRPCDFMTNTYQWIGTIEREGAVYNPTGGARTALIAPEDVASVAVKCLTQSNFDGRTLHLTGAEALSVPEQVALLSQVLSRPIRCVDVSVQQAVENLIRSGMSAISARYVEEIYEREGRGEGSKITRDFVEITAKAPKTFRAWAEDHSKNFR
jgi:(4-alkanoyl-5-oxo-2,5-dihydrofuran-3-yl)methyl phosphate reductase